jgi:hypothetical protein
LVGDLTKTLDAPAASSASAKGLKRRENEELQHLRLSFNHDLDGTSARAVGDLTKKVLLWWVI